MLLYRNQGVAKGKGGQSFGDGPQVQEFFAGRLESLWSEGDRPDLVKAVLAADFDDLVQMRLRLDALEAMVKGKDFGPLAVTFKRVANIVSKQAKDVQPGAVDHALLKEAEEQTLFHQFQTTRGEVEQAFAKDDFSGGLQPPGVAAPAGRRLLRQGDGDRRGPGAEAEPGAPVDEHLGAVSPGGRLRAHPGRVRRGAPPIF